MAHEKSGKLTFRQQLGLAYLITASSVEEASRQSGIPHSTFWRWLRDPNFASHYEAHTAGALEVAGKRLRNLTALAANTLQEVMEDKTAPAGSRAAAARTVLEMVQRQRELTEIEERLQQLEAIAQTKVARPVRVA